jgi:hypothetical protein
LATDGTDGTYGTVLEDFVLTVATNVETLNQAQPADATCVAYHDVVAALTGSAPLKCTFYVPHDFIGTCTCVKAGTAAADATARNGGDVATANGVTALLGTATTTTTTGSEGADDGTRTNAANVAIVARGSNDPKGLPKGVSNYILKDPVRPEILRTWRATVYSDQSATDSLHEITTTIFSMSAELRAVGRHTTLKDNRTTPAVSFYGTLDPSKPSPTVPKAGIFEMLPFFNYTVCNVFPIPFIGGATSYHQETFEDALVEDITNFDVTTFYAKTKYVHRGV